MFFFFPVDWMELHKEDIHNSHVQVSPLLYICTALRNDAAGPEMLLNLVLGTVITGNKTKKNQKTPTEVFFKSLEMFFPNPKMRPKVHRRAQVGKAEALSF